MTAMAIGMKLWSSSALLLLFLCCFLLPSALAEERFYEFVVSLVVDLATCVIHAAYDTRLVVNDVK
jgi:hypothetical protein